MDPKLEGTVHMKLQMLYLHLRSVPSWLVWTASPMVPGEGKDQCEVRMVPFMLPFAGNAGLVRSITSQKHTGNG